MKILVINCGSSSIKYQLFEMNGELVLAKGMVDRIGIEGSALIHQPANRDKVKIDAEIKDHSVGIKMVLDALTDPEHGVIASMDEIMAVGHRVVHGGERFSDSVLITPEAILPLTT
jgi:acetate kinase